MRDTALPVAALLTCLALFPLNAQVQPRPATLTAGPGRLGSIVVGDAGQPVSAAAITVRNAADSAVIAGSMTGRDGRFRIEGLPVGEYLVRISHIGYKPVNAPRLRITAAAPAVDLGTIRLEVAPIELQAVQANAQRSPVVLEADRTVYNTKDMPAAAGTAVDLLRAIPELEVDVNGRVTLRGNQAAAIHLNGRPAPISGEALANFLQQLPGNRVAKIEVVPNPSAKYDPAGISGIINIQLKDNADLGLSGNISANTSTRLARAVTGRANFQKGRVTMFSGGSLTFSNNSSSNYDLRQNLLAQPVTFIEQRGTIDGDNHFNSIDFTGELRVGRQATMWTSLFAYSSANLIDLSTAYGIRDQSQALQERYDRTRVNDNGFSAIDIGLGFKQVFQPQKQELTFDLRRTTSDQSAANRLICEYFLSNAMQVELPLEVWLDDIATSTNALSAQADYFRAIGSGWRLDAGYWGYDRIEHYDNRLDVFDDTMSDDETNTTLAGYRYEEIFQSLYALIGHTRGKVNVQLGLRGEVANTQFDLPVTHETFDMDYNSVFPSANLSYDVGQGRSLRLSYSKRISRPYPQLLNPVVPALDPLNRTAGNPHIKPAYTHSFTADFSKVGQYGTLRLTPYYRRTADNWENIKNVDSLGVSTVTWENSELLESYGANVIASLRPTHGVSGSANIGLNRDVRDASNLANEYVRASFRWSVGANASVQATPTLALQSNLRYTPAYDLVQGRVAGSFMSTMGVRQQVRNNRGSISLLLNDPFDLYRYRFVTHDQTHVQNSSSTYKIRTATLSVTYNFGRTPQQASRRNPDDQSGGGPSSPVIR